MPQEAVIRVDTDGVCTFLHDDELVELVEAGKSSIMRVSHVEPDRGGQWRARLVHDGRILGPFRLRSEALAAELEAIQEVLSH